VQDLEKGKIYSDKIRPTCANDFWEKNARISKAHMCMEMQVMNTSISHNPPRTPTTPFSVPPVEKNVLDFFEICIEVITVAPVLNLTVSAE